MRSSCFARSGAIGSAHQTESHPSGARGAPRTEGERWAQRELERLLAARFAPRAVGAFLVASQRRTNATRAARPAHAAQVRFAIATGGVAWIVLGARGPHPVRAARRSGPAWWALVALMLDWHLGMFETEDGAARPLGPADALTLARAWLVPVAAADPSPAVVLVAASTDVLDGIAARAAMPTRAGRDLEGLVDAAFLAAVLLGMGRSGRLATGPLALEAARQAVGVAYAFGVYFGRAAAPDATLLRAGRGLTTVRVGALALAGAGRRRAGGALLAASSLAALAALGRTVAAGRRARA